MSAVREKVWFCTQKGYKPWLKPRQADVRLNEQGGHALWYDEQALLKVRKCPILSLPMKVLLLGEARLIRLIKLINVE